MIQHSHNIRFLKAHPNAIVPYQVNDDAVGFDVTALDYIELGDALIMVDTHIIAKPPLGYWLQLVARSSLFKHNLMPVNGFGVIDPDYRGHIKFVLKRINSNKPYPVFPLRFGQLIPILLSSVGGTEVTELKSTSRGEAGFGSSGI